MSLIIEQKDIKFFNKLDPATKDVHEKIKKLETELNQIKENIAIKEEKKLLTILKENGFSFDNIQIYNINIYLEETKKTLNIATIKKNETTYYLTLNSCTQVYSLNLDIFNLVNINKLLLQEEIETIKNLINLNYNYERLLEITI